LSDFEFVVKLPRTKNKLDYQDRPPVAGG